MQRITLLGADVNFLKCYALLMRGEHQISPMCPVVSPCSRKASLLRVPFLPKGSHVTVP